MKKLLHLIVLMGALLALWPVDPVKAQVLIRAEPVTLQSAATSTLDGTTINVERWGSLSLQVTGISGDTVAFEALITGSTWASTVCTKSADGSAVTSTTSNGLFRCPVSGYRAFRARVSAYSAGTITVTGQLTTVAVGGLGGGGGGTSVAASLQGSDTLPATCTVKDVYHDTNGGTNAQVYFCSATDTWTALLTAEAQGLNDVVTIGREVTTANSQPNSVKIGDGTNKMEHWWESGQGGYIRPNPLGDNAWRCWTNFNCIIRDEEGGATVLTIDPDAPSKNAMYQFGSAYKPIASFLLPLEPRGAATSASESLNTNFEKQWYLTVTDANTDAADFSFPVTAKMAGATTATFRLFGVSKNASPSGNIDFDCAMATSTPGTDTLAAHSTTGEVTALLTPATQYRPVAVTTSAHTINGGALVDGDIVFGSCEVDATATTSAQMSDFRLWGYVLVQLSVNSWSD